MGDRDESEKSMCGQLMFYVNGKKVCGLLCLREGCMRNIVMTASVCMYVCSLAELHHFYARQHICYSAYMLWQFRLSVCPSVCHTGGSVKNG